MCDTTPSILTLRLSIANGDSLLPMVHTASFCHGRAGHYDMFDQAISFFLPNMTWLQVSLIPSRVPCIVIEIPVAATEGGGGGARAQHVFFKTVIKIQLY